MTHDPERLAAEYLADMGQRPRRRFERHLLACERCWDEVMLARRGRELAETLAEPAPVGIREQSRAGVAAAAMERQAGADPLRGRRVLVAAVAAAAALTVAAGAVAVVPQLRPWDRSDVLAGGVPAGADPAGADLAGADPAGADPAGADPVLGPAVAAAIDGFRQRRLPGTAVPTDPAPDLRTLGFELVAAGAGPVNGDAVTMYQYRGRNGARLAVYRSSRAFPEAGEADEVPGVETAWQLQSGDVAVLCGPQSHTTLLLSNDLRLARTAGHLLGLV